MLRGTSAAPVDGHEHGFMTQIISEHAVPHLLGFTEYLSAVFIQVEQGENECRGCLMDIEGSGLKRDLFEQTGS